VARTVKVKQHVSRHHPTLSALLKVANQHVHLLKAQDGHFASAFGNK
jgi:hypothetical protein